MRVREVICPLCEHRFMWMESSEGMVFHSYRCKESGELLEDTACPKCGEKLVILPDSLKAALPDDDRIEKTWERGI